ncbi:MAG: hypothetical protein EBV06_16525, partial [Planctomycetia bacterium]|nr:hypothetical protein [Planctomycetia bacterium]
SASQNLSILSQTGSVQVNTSLDVSGNLLIVSGQDIVLPNAVTTGGTTTLTAGGDIRAASTLSAGGALSITAQNLVSLKSNVTARNTMSIISQGGDVIVPVTIAAQSGSSLSELLLSAGGNLVLAGGRLPVVTTRMTLNAGQELQTGIGEPSWMVSGASGELSVTAGGNVVQLQNMVMQAGKRVTIRSTGYIDDQGNAVGGNVAFIGTPSGLNGNFPQELVLSAKNYLHLNQNVKASQKLTLDGGQVTTSNLQLLSQITGDLLGNPGGTNAVNTLTGSIMNYPTGDLVLSGDAVLTPALGDPAMGTGDRIKVIGTVTITGNATLNPVPYYGYSPKVGEQYVILQNDGTDAIQGTFAGLQEGYAISNFMGSQFSGLITYQGNADGGSVGNDIIVTVVPFVPNLATSVDSSGNLVIEDISNNGRDNDMIFSADGTFLYISDDNESFTSSSVGSFVSGRNSMKVPLSSFGGGIIIKGKGGNDIITIQGTQLGNKSLSLDVESVTLTGTLTTTGSVTIQSGMMQLTGDNQLGNGVDLVVPTGATLDLSGNNVTIDGLSGAGTVRNDSGESVTLTAGAGNQTSTFNGVITNGSGTVSLVKVGSGTLTLTSNNPYTGSTTVQGGRLIVMGQIYGGTSVIAGGTLETSGTITGNVNNGGTVKLISSPGTMNVNGNFTSTGSLGIGITRPITTATASINYDQVNVTGAVSLNGTLGLSFSGSGSIADRQVFTVVNNDGADPVSGTFSGLVNGSTFTANGQSWVIFYDGGTGNDVTLTTVPSLKPSVVYVNDDWGNMINGSVNFSSQFSDEVMGYNAFTDMATALSKVAPGGTVYITGGAYGGSYTISDSGLQFRVIQDSEYSQTTVSLSGVITLAAATTFTLYDDATYDLADLTFASGGSIEGGAALSVQTSTNGIGVVAFDGFIGGTTAIASLTIGSSGAKLASVSVNKIVSSGSISLYASGAISESGSDTEADLIGTTLTLVSGTGI